MADEETQRLEGGEDETQQLEEEEQIQEHQQEQDLGGDDQEQVHMVDQEQEQEQEQVTDQDLLQQFSAVDADGNTVLLSAESLQQLQNNLAANEEFIETEGDGNANTQEYGEEIIGDGEGGVGEEEGDLITHTMLDEHGNQQVIRGSAAAIQDLITLHGLDAQGNIMTARAPGEVDPDEDLDNVDMGMDQSNMDSMMDTGNMVEEVITGNNDDERFSLTTTEPLQTGSDMSGQYLNVQEAIFNTATGTLQPISAANAPGASQSKPVTTKAAKKKVQQPVTKYVITQQSGEGGQSQQIVLDAQSLQGLLQGGGNTLTFSGASGKQQILLAPQSQSPQKGKITKSPAKILPAPVPIGDQQQQASAQRFLLKQGTVLTPISQMSQGGATTRLIQMPSTGPNQPIQYLRVVQKQGTPTPTLQNTIQYKVPIARASKPKPVAPKPAPSQQTIFTLPSGVTGDLSSLQNSRGNCVVLPNSVVSLKPLLEPNGMRQRKPCSCAKSKCLKLYCECFSNGQFCHLCNCKNCHNNLDHEEDRQKAIKLVLEKRPGAFRPKIGKSSQTGEAHVRRHSKGCKCKRSGCLKKYCECFEAKIFCSGNCKCTGCKNCLEQLPLPIPSGFGIEQHFAGTATSSRHTLKDLAEGAEVGVQQQTQVKNKTNDQIQEVSPQNNLGILVPPVIFRDPQESIGSYEVVFSTAEVLLARAEAVEKHRLPDGEMEKSILEEFGDCLSSLIKLGNTTGINNNFN